MYDPDEIEEEQREREKRNKINADFKQFTTRVQVGVCGGGGGCGWWWWWWCDAGMLCGREKHHYPHAGVCVCAGAAGQQAGLTARGGGDIG